MRFAIADPPYLGCAHRYPEHPESHLWNTLEAHKELIEFLAGEFSTWAYFASSSSLAKVLPLCPDNFRVLVWAKSFASFKKGVNPAYAWEPVIIRSLRSRGDQMPYMRDFCIEPITLKKGLCGAKPKNVIIWLFDALNVRPGDELVDMFPGTGIIERTWEEYSQNYDSVASPYQAISAKWIHGKGTVR